MSEHHIGSIRVERAALLERLTAAIADLSRHSARRGMLETAAGHLTDLLDGRACFVSQVRDGMLRDAAIYAPAPFLRFEGWDYLLSDYPQTQETLTNGHPRAVSLTDEKVDESEAFVLRELGMHSVLMIPLHAGREVWGLAEVYDTAPRRFTAEDVLVARLLASQIDALLSVFAHHDAVEVVYRETLAALANALEAKDSGTSVHTQNVAEMAVQVAQELRVDADTERAIELGALLHDIGKIHIPETILAKQGPLEPAEWDVMRRHTVFGERILQPISSLHDVLPIVRSSHERWDGDGYPDGLRGTEIPLGARIVAVCDAYCAMTEPRPYRAPIDDATAAAELRRGAGTQFDPSCVEALLASLAENRPVRLHRPAHLRS